MTGGALRAAGEKGGVLTLGPVVIFGKKGEKVRWGTGISATYLTRDEFGTSDPGGRFHFTSHLSVGYRFNRRFVLNYRAQHMSNAGIQEGNPGLYIHYIEGIVQFR
ncbi:MAG: acyloxyacyl hydrolase [bacterium]|nr:MAG: acyloxyacyl hydrolase [bacterium]